MNYNDVLDKIARQLESKLASTFFINGAPGTGKSYLQNRLAQDLPNRFSRAKVLGPYKVGLSDAIGIKILKDLKDLLYIEDVPDEKITDDLGSSWRWIKENLQITTRSALIVLIDLESVKWDDYDGLRVWFSSMRYLEHFWDTGNVRIAVIVTSFWDHSGLDSYYADELKLSFPYTLSQNYLVWEEIPQSDSLTLLGNLHSDDPIQIVYAKLLHELAGGNPKVMQDILTHLQSAEPSVGAMLNATLQAATSGAFGKELINAWKILPMESLNSVQEILLLRQVPVNTLPPKLERLKVAGILYEKMVLNQRYVTLRSWYVELLLRLNMDKLGIQSGWTSMQGLAELMPTITVVHQDAYLLLHQIENLLRNFLVTHLEVDKSDDEPLLAGKGYKDVNVYENNQSKKRELDAQERAEQWQERSREHGLPTNLNSIIAYLSLGDLGIILKELGQSKNTTFWLQVADAIERVVYIRDAVMHNQIIEISDLREIHDLQKEIFSALSETSRSFPRLH